MTLFKIGAAAALALLATSASAGEFRYTGSPKFGQYYVSGPAAGGTAAIPGIAVPRSAYDANAMLVESPAPLRKGGIGLRAP